MRIAIFGNTYREVILSHIRLIVDCLRQHEVTFLFDKKLYDFACSALNLDRERVEIIATDRFTADLALSIGGDGTFLTTRDGGGIGLLSIRFIAERYGGSCRFEAENGSFYSLVYMNIDHLSPDGTGILDDTKAAAPTGTM